MLLTVAFDIILGLLSNDTLPELIEAYDIAAGNFWLLAVLFTGIAPWLAAKTRKLI